MFLWGAQARPGAEFPLVVLSYSYNPLLRLWVSLRRGLSVDISIGGSVNCKSYAVCNLVSCIVAFGCGWLMVRRPGAEYAKLTSVLEW